MKIAILNYFAGSVEIIEDAPEMEYEDVEEWLVEHGYNLDCIDWMTDVKSVGFYKAKDLES